MNKNEGLGLSFGKMQKIRIAFDSAANSWHQVVRKPV